MALTFLESLNIHEGVRDQEAKQYVDSCLKIEAVAVSASLRCIQVLIPRVESLPIVLKSDQATLALRLLLSHLVETILTIRQAASDGRVTVAFVLMRTAEDTLDLVAALCADPTLIDQYAVDRERIEAFRRRETL